MGVNIQTKRDVLERDRAPWFHQMQIQLANAWDINPNTRDRDLRGFDSIPFPHFRKFHDYFHQIISLFSNWSKFAEAVYHTDHSKVYSWPKYPLSSIPLSSAPLLFPFLHLLHSYTQQHNQFDDIRFQLRRRLLRWYFQVKCLDSMFRNRLKVEGVIVFEMMVIWMMTVEWSDVVEVESGELGWC